MYRKLVIGCVFLLMTGLSVITISCEKEPELIPDPPPPNTDSTTPITLIDSINIGNHNNTAFSSFLNLKTGAVYSLSTDPKGVDNQSSVDLVYYYNTINHTDAFLGAPTTAGSNNATGGIYDNNPDGINFWTTVKNTQFGYASDISVGDFNNIDNLAELRSEWGTLDIGLYYEYAVQSERVYRFKTVENKIGLLKINTIVGSGQNVGTMNVSIKTQQ